MSFLHHNMKTINEMKLKYFLPSECKSGRLCRSENVQHVAVGGQHREADVLKDRVWRAQLKEQHDEDAVVWDLKKW